MPRAQHIETTVSLRDLDWVVVGTYQPGSRPYWDRSIGVMLPGDDAEICIEGLTGDGHDGQLDEDDLSTQERERVEQAIECAAGEE